MTTSRPKVLWLQGVACNGNGHSFINAADFERVLNSFEFLYHPLFPTKHSLLEIAKKDFQIDILIVEGALRSQGYERGGIESLDLITKYAEQAEHIIAVGNCAAFGGLLGRYDRERMTGVIFQEDEATGLLQRFKEKSVNLPGCPIHPQWLVYTLEMMRKGEKILRDKLLRPVELYAYTVHEGCLRNEYFEWKVDIDSFGRKEGCLYYEHGCQGPFTHGSCNRILWNQVNSKTRAGMPCIGCTEPDFPTNGLFRTKTLMSIPARMPLGIPKRAYLTLTGVAKAFNIPRLQRRKIEDAKPSDD